MSYTKNLQGVLIAEDLWINNLINKINGLEGDACAELQTIKDDCVDYLNKKLNALTSRSQVLAIVQFLLNIPNDIDAVIAWIKNLITFLIKPYYEEYLLVIEQIAAIPAQAAKLASACEGAASRLEACFLSFPDIPVTVPTPFPAPAPTTGS